jgi:hypothetical protein
MSKYVFAAAALLLTLAVFSATSVKAEATINNSSTAREAFREHWQTAVQPTIAAAKATTKEERQVVKQETAAGRCEKVTSRINSRLNFYEQNKDKYSSRYQGYRKHIEDMLPIWKDKGCDIAKLEQDLPVFDTLVTDFADSFRDFIASLQGTRAYICGESQGLFAGELKQSHDKLTIVRQKALALKNFVQGTLKPDVKTARESCPLKVKPTLKVTGAEQ